MFHTSVCFAYIVFPKLSFLVARVNWDSYAAIGGAAGRDAAGGPHSVPRTAVDPGSVAGGTWHVLAAGRPGSGGRAGVIRPLRGPAHANSRVRVVGVHV